MTSRVWTSSRPNSWVQPRPYTDADMRRMKHGRIQPMDYGKPTLLQRLFGIA